MTCHSQFLDQAPMLAPLRRSLASGTPLMWSRVNNLPDYVYFDHSIHVAKGVGCEICHGRIDKMPLTRVENPFTMELCLDCHRDPRPYLRPTDRVFTMGWRRQGDARALGRELLRANRVDTAHLTDCYTCHR